MPTFNLLYMTDVERSHLRGWDVRDIVNSHNFPRTDSERLDLSVKDNPIFSIIHYSLEQPHPRFKEYKNGFVLFEKSKLDFHRVLDFGGAGILYDLAGTLDGVIFAGRGDKLGTFLFCGLLGKTPKNYPVQK